MALLTSSVVQVPMNDLSSSVCSHSFWLVFSAQALHNVKISFSYAVDFFFLPSSSLWTTLMRCVDTGWYSFLGGTTLHLISRYRDLSYFLGLNIFVGWPTGCFS